jgi:microcystin-dependent protein
MSHLVQPGSIPVPDSSELADAPTQMDAMARAVAAALYFVGELRCLAGAAAPTPQWLLCDGAAIGRTAYAKLYAAIGVVYGVGDGSTTFNLPDLRGRAPVGTGSGTGLSARAVGAKWGVESIVLATAQLPAHSHPVSETAHNHPIAAVGNHSHGGITGNDAPDHTHNVGNLYNGAGGTFLLATNTGNPNPINTGGRSAFHQHGITADGGHNHTLTAATTGLTVSNSGGDGAHDNTVPSLAVPFYIFAGV